MLKRSITIDSIKGILILLVVLGHALQYGFGADYLNLDLYYDDYLFRAIYCFHMPLFMFISGYLFFKSNQKPCFKVILSKLKTIGIPFVIYVTLIIAWNHIFWENHLYLSYFFGVIRMGTEMWFLWSLLVNCIIVSLVNYMTKGKERPMFIGLGMFCLLSLFVSDKVLLPQHKFVFPFFIMGYFYNALDVYWTSYLKNYRLFVVISFLYFMCILIYGKDMMIYHGGFCVVGEKGIIIGQLFKDILRWGIGIISSCWIMSLYYLVITKWHAITTLFVKLGRQTLVFYGLQSILYKVFSDILEVYNIHIPHFYLWGIAVCLLVLGLCGILILLLKQNQIFRRLFMGKD